MSTPLKTWRAICSEAEVIVVQGRKYLLLDEEMCFRLGEALENQRCRTCGHEQNYALTAKECAR